MFSSKLLTTTLRTTPQQTLRSLSGGNNNIGEVRHVLDVEKCRPAFIKSGMNNAATCDIQVGQFKHGQSNPTYTLNLDGTKYVLRKKPPGKLLRGAHAVEREYEIMSKLGAVGFPVPKTWFFEEDVSVVGTPYFVCDFTEGAFYADCTMKNAPSPEVRKELYDSMIGTVAQFHGIDYKAAGLGGYGKEGDYLKRQTKVWTMQYKAAQAAASTPDDANMEKLMMWLNDALPKDDDLTTLVHGDLRVDNMIFDVENRKVASVLDWELSTLGHPATDLALLCTPYHTPNTVPIIGGLMELSPADLKAIGIPTEHALLDTYVEKGGRAQVAEHLDFYYAFAAFRMASIMQGVHARSLAGQASSTEAGKVGQMVGFMAELAVKHSQRYEANPGRLTKHAGAGAAFTK